MTRAGLLALVLRGLVALALALMLAPHAEPRLLAWLAPVWARVAETLDGDFRVLAVQVGGTGVERSLQMQLEPARFFTIDGRIYEPGAGQGGSVALPRGTVWQTLSLHLVVLVAWPLRRGPLDAARAAAGAQRSARRAPPWWIDLALRAALGLAALTLLLALLVPTELLGQLRTLLYEGSPSAHWSALRAAGPFLAGGGRVLAVLVVASACCLAADALATWMHRQVHSDQGRRAVA